MAPRAPTIGILAGMGPASTAPFLNRVLDECRRQYGAQGDMDFPKIVICSQPAPFHETLPIDHGAMKAAILDGLDTLERAGADFLAIACNSAHIYYAELAQRVNVPLLSIVDSALAALSPSARVALISSRATVDAHFYQDRMRTFGFARIDIAWQDEADALLIAARDRAEPEILIAHWAALVARAKAAGADVLLIACLDLSAALRFAPASIKMVDSAACLAHDIVQRWRGNNEKIRQLVE